MVQFCVANEVSWRCGGVCICCPTRSSRGTQILTRRSQSDLGILGLPLGRLHNGHLHILEYLVERKYDHYSVYACAFAAGKRPLRLFEVLTRNRQSAVGLSRPYKAHTRTTNPSVYNTSSTITVHYHVGDTKEECYARSARCKHVHGYTKRERRERDTKNTQNTEERKNSQIAAAFLLLYIIT